MKKKSQKININRRKQENYVLFMFNCNNLTRCKKEKRENERQNKAKGKCEATRLRPTVLDQFYCNSISVPVLF